MKKGSTHTPESKLKSRLSRLGKKPWNTGKQLPAWVREKISRTLTGKPQPNQVGEKNHQWKGGISSLDKQIRNCLHYKNWRTAVFIRDDYTCQLCGIRGAKIHADHIEALSSILRRNNVKTFLEALSCDEIWDTKNGRVLCVECHKETPTYAGRSLKNRT